MNEKVLKKRLELALVIHNCIVPLIYFSLIKDYLFNPFVKQA